MMKTFKKHESDVSGYIKSFPKIFDRAEQATLYCKDGKPYIDFFAGAGTLNYGHNPDFVNEALIKYLSDKRITHSLDKATIAKKEFIESFVNNILQPRGLNYKLQFTGPTGTNAVEASLKLSRMIKKRSNIIAFTNAYHGLTLASLAITGSDFYRDESFGHRVNSDSLPYCGFFGQDDNTINYIYKMISNKSSGVDLPAAFIVETVQGEGGINVATIKWLQQLSQLCKEFDILLIVDDIQMGNGRTGPFFSFERAGIVPDIVCLSKAIGGSFPMSLVLIKPELDIWKPGEHTGTFRGNNLAFVASTEIINHYWNDEPLSIQTEKNEKKIHDTLEEWSKEIPSLKFRGLGMAWGLEFDDPSVAKLISQEAFSNYLLCETCGSENQVVKLLPPLTIPTYQLQEGLAVLKRSIKAVLKKEGVSV